MRTVGTTKLRTLQFYFWNTTKIWNISKDFFERNSTFKKAFGFVQYLEARLRAFCGHLWSHVTKKPVNEDKPGLQVETIKNWLYSLINE